MAVIIQNLSPQVLELNMSHAIVCASTGECSCVSGRKMTYDYDSRGKGASGARMARWIDTQSPKTLRIAPMSRSAPLHNCFASLPEVKGAQRKGSALLHQA